MTTIERRLQRLEQAIRTQGCAACRDEPTQSFTIQLFDEPDPETECPACGRVLIEQVVAFTTREDGPQ